MLHIFSSGASIASSPGPSRCSRRWGWGLGYEASVSSVRGRLVCDHTSVFARGWTELDSAQLTVLPPLTLNMLGENEISAVLSKVNGGNSGHMDNSGQRQFLQQIGRRRRPRRRESFPTASSSIPYRRRCRRRPIRCKNCCCPELSTCPEFPPFTLLLRRPSSLAIITLLFGKEL